MSVNFRDSITVTRYANGSYVNGVYTAGASGSVTGVWAWNGKIIPAGFRV